MSRKTINKKWPHTDKQKKHKKESDKVYRKKKKNIKQQAAWSRRHYLKNKKAYIARAKKDWETNPKSRGWYILRTIKKFNLSEERYHSLVKAGCAICGSTKSGTHIDHDHAKPIGESFRGILCVKCNVSLGGLGDNKEGLLKALAYLENNETHKQNTNGTN